MADKMLIDASHEEETRVVVVRGNRIEEFDFESQHKKQLRGNIYLAKVTRVEPSLQAAFVDYGGNRHGFLAFSEIHPDYYQIPLADREALLREASEDNDNTDSNLDEPVQSSKKKGDQEDNNEPETGEAVEATKPKPRTRRGRARSRPPPQEDAQTKVDQIQTVTSESEVSEAVISEIVATEVGTSDATKTEAKAETSADAELTDEVVAKPKPRRRREPAAKAVKKATDVDATSAESPAGDTQQAPSSDSSDDDSSGGPTHMAAKIDSDSISEDVDDDDSVESVGAEDAMEEVPDRNHRKTRKHYRIQEVIKRRQILLVQIAKEERGNKGAALSTFLSLAGRYSVLMPNTARGGGISRKITNLADRKRLKDVAKDLEVPQGMGVILRTAGANRTKAEVKRDFEYLMRLWENVRTKTLTSTAPSLVYEEGSLIKRSIRDLYNKDINEIIVSGDEAYREAKDFMKMLMPSHAKVVQPYRDIHPIYSRSGIEAQLDRMLQPQVTLKSGGYLIINQTEALVAVDVNSGRSTREHSIEDTALQTNLEAAEEVARQLRLRDLAGLVVIDFIDMEENRNNRAVEKKMKECLKSDRARIQVGRISHFGLLEMSRQRIRASVLESTTQVCAQCGGTGHILSQSSVALHVLRGVEEYLLKNTTHNITVRCVPETALYILNQKRSTIIDYEARFGVEIIIESDNILTNAHFEIDRGEAVSEPVKIEALFVLDDEPEDIVEPEVKVEIEVIAETSTENSDEDNRPKRNKRRRRRGRGGQQSENNDVDQAQADSEGDSDDQDENVSADSDEAASDKQPRRKRRRGKRGGRRNRSDEDGQQETENGIEGAEATEDENKQSITAEPSDQDNGETNIIAVESKAIPAETVDITPSPASEVGENDAMAEIEGRKPRRRRTRKPKTAVAETVGVDDAAIEVPAKALMPTAESEKRITKAEEIQQQSVISNADSIASSNTPNESVSSELSKSIENVTVDHRAANAVTPEPIVTSETPVGISKADGAVEDDAKSAKPKRGWWQRRGFL